MYLKGVIRHGADVCVHCRLGVGPYSQCVMVPGSVWGCANRVFSKESTNCQWTTKSKKSPFSNNITLSFLSSFQSLENTHADTRHVDRGVITYKMMHRIETRANLMLQESQKTAGDAQAFYIQWRTTEVAKTTFINIITAVAVADEAIRRVASQPGNANHYAMNSTPAPTIEIMQGLNQPFNAMYEALNIVRQNRTADEKVNSKPFESEIYANTFSTSLRLKDNALSICWLRSAPKLRVSSSSTRPTSTCSETLKVLLKMKFLRRSVT